MSLVLIYTCLASVSSAAIQCPCAAQVQYTENVSVPAVNAYQLQPFSLHLYRLLNHRASRHTLCRRMSHLKYHPTSPQRGQRGNQRLCHQHNHRGHPHDSRRRNPQCNHRLLRVSLPHAHPSLAHSLAPNRRTVHQKRYLHFYHDQVFIVFGFFNFYSCLLVHFGHYPSNSFRADG